VSWLPAGFEHPLREDLPSGHHLRPIRGEDVDIDMPAVMGSRERLWAKYGEAWGWPAETITHEADRADLERHAEEIERHETFNYAVLDEDETELLGCVYIDPPERAGADADVSWWVVDSLVGSDVEAELDELVPYWVAQDWPFEKPRYVPREMTWAQWLALPETPAAG
jgi:hypothetical protein